MFFSSRRDGSVVTAGVGRVVATVLVGGLLLAGCGGAEEPPAPAPSTQVEQEPTPTETTETAVPETVEPEERPVPEEPEAMKTGDKAGAIAAAKFFVEVIEYDMHTNTTELLEKYSFEECGRCNYLVSLIEERVDQGKKSVSSSYSVTETGEPEFVGQGVIMWLVPVNISIHEKFGEELEEYKEEVNLGVAVMFDEGKWTLVELENVHL